MTPIPLELPDGDMAFHHLVLDFTGTLSVDGTLLPGVSDRLTRLSSDLAITVLTADTFGTAQEALKDLPITLRVIHDGMEKAEAVRSLEPRGVVAIGNGRNDIPMMGAAELSIAVLGPEGAAADLFPAVDLVARTVNDALDLLLHPFRLKATLRS